MWVSKRHFGIPREFSFFSRSTAITRNARLRQFQGGSSSQGVYVYSPFRYVEVAWVVTVGNVSEIGQFSLLEGDGICEGPSQKGEGTTRRRGEGLDFCMTSDFPRIKMYQMCQVCSDSKRVGNRMIFNQAFRSSNETVRTNRLHGSWMELGLPSQCPSVPVASGILRPCAQLTSGSKAKQTQAGPHCGCSYLSRLLRHGKNPCSFAQKIGGRAPQLWPQANSSSQQASAIPKTRPGNRGWLWSKRFLWYFLTQPNVIGQNQIITIIVIAILSHSHWSESDSQLSTMIISMVSKCQNHQTESTCNYGQLVFFILLVPSRDWENDTTNNHLIPPFPTKHQKVIVLFPWHLPSRYEDIMLRSHWGYTAYLVMRSDAWRSRCSGKAKAKADADADADADDDDVGFGI